MKLFLLSACTLFSCSVLTAQDRSINFEHNTWVEIKAKAAKEKKPIFLDAFTTWCGPCKKIAREVFTQNEVADYFNSNFINAKMDMEKGEGPGLVKQYAINAYPSLLFIDAKGKIISKRVGALDAKTFLAFGKMSSSGESLEYLMTQYKKGNRDAAFMKKFLTRMEGIGENTGRIIDEYFTKTPQVKWQLTDNWYFIERYIKNERSPVFKYVLKNQKAFEQKVSAEVVSEYFVSVYRNSIQKAANSVFATEDLQELKDSIGKMDFAGTAKLALECDAAIADRNKDMKAYVDIMEVYYTTYPEKEKEMQIYQVGSLCWKILNQSSDPYVLGKATKLAEMSMQLQDPEFMDVYARLLFETGDVNKAIEVEEKVVAMLKANPATDVSLAECEERLEKFNRKKAGLSPNKG